MNLKVLQSNFYSFACYPCIAMEFALILTFETVTLAVTILDFAFWQLIIYVLLERKICSN